MDENFQNTLLKEFDDHRNAIKEMIKDLEKIKSYIDKLFPETLDKRYIMMFQEKMKAITGLFTTLLDMRKEITKSIKDEIELRRKLEGKDSVDNFEEMVDIRQLERKFNELNRTKLKVEEKVVKAEETVLEENTNE